MIFARSARSESGAGVLRWPVAGIWQVVRAAEVRHAAASCLMGGWSVRARNVTSPFSCASSSMCRRISSTRRWPSLDTTIGTISAQRRR